MKKFDIEFEVTQKFLYSVTIEANTPEEAVKILQEHGIPRDNDNSEEDCMLESNDDYSTAKCVGERVVYDLHTNSTHRIALKDNPVTFVDDYNENNRK